MIIFINVDKIIFINTTVIGRRICYKKWNSANTRQTCTKILVLTPDSVYKHDDFVNTFSKNFGRRSVNFKWIPRHFAAFLALSFVWHFRAEISNVLGKKQDFSSWGYCTNCSASISIFPFCFLWSVSLKVYLNLIYLLLFKNTLYPFMI